MRDAICAFAPPSTESSGGYVIEKGVPYEQHTSHKYPFAQMEPGDSFLVPQGVSQNRASAAAVNYGKRTGKVFRTKKTVEGVRVWRIA